MACYPTKSWFLGLQDVVVVGFSSVLTIASKASSPSQLLLVVCVILGTAVAFCDIDWGMGSQSAIV
jgi:hypothetical protein